MRRFVLASSSPRRLSLLKQIGVVPDFVVPAEINEEVVAGELPKNYAARMAHEKHQVVAAQHVESFVLAADTVVFCGRRILGKALSNDDVIRFLTLLSGRRHRVVTAVCVSNPQGIIVKRNVMTSVQFKRLSQQEICYYAETGEGIGKAGGYAIQGAAERFVKQINGNYSNVVGLPLYDTKNILEGLGYV